MELEQDSSVLQQSYLLLYFCVTCVLKIKENMKEIIFEAWLTYFNSVSERSWTLPKVDASGRNTSMVGRGGHKTD